MENSISLRGIAIFRNYIIGFKAQRTLIRALTLLCYFNNRWVAKFKIPYKPVQSEAVAALLEITSQQIKYCYFNQLLPVIYWISHDYFSREPTPMWNKLAARENSAYKGFTDFIGKRCGKLHAELEERMHLPSLRGLTSLQTYLKLALVEGGEEGTQLT